jgi:hypothetical protein
MARLPRYVIPGQPQHIIQRGNNRQAIFAAEGDYQFFRDCLVEAAGRFGLAIHAYVWMTNGWYSGSDTNIRASQHRPSTSCRKSPTGAPLPPLFPQTPRQY